VDEENTKKVLIVDDQMQMREMMRYVLVSHGYKNLLIADNGREAMQLIHKEAIAAVITDWAMPHMSGIEILKTIKNNADLFEIPVGPPGPEWSRK
jgi:two-component system, chemotaxis family, chemotaxis protein CheY